MIAFRSVSGIFARPFAQKELIRRSLFQGIDKIVQKKFAKLKIPDDAIVATYIWIDGTGERTRSKSKVMTKEPTAVSDFTKWHYDGSSTYQARGDNSDVTLKPVYFCKDPFLGGKHKLVMCETQDSKGKPLATNHRAECMEVLEKTQNEDAWFGMEQEYTLLQPNGRPLGWPSDGMFPRPQGPYYCAHGSMRSFGRDIADSHLLACIYAGLMVTGTNAEVMPGQWEYQLGPINGRDLGDQLWLSRFILERLSEEFGADVTLDPKPVEGDWNGAGNHCNFSTKAMREDGGLEVIKEAIKKLEKRHDEHIKVYDPHSGHDNLRRLTGEHETASIDKFSWGIGHRGVSIRVPRPVAENGKGWLEDRRPSANCDPYQVVARLLKTVCLDQ